VPLSTPTNPTNTAKVLKISSAHANPTATNHKTVPIPDRLHH